MMQTSKGLKRKKTQAPRRSRKQRNIAVFVVNIDVVYLFFLASRCSRGTPAISHIKGLISKVLVTPFCRQGGDLNDGKCVNFFHFRAEQEHKTKFKQPLQPNILWPSCLAKKHKTCFGECPNQQKQCAQLYYCCTFDFCEALIEVQRVSNVSV